jgi:hypothetical protein
MSEFQGITITRDETRERLDEIALIAAAYKYNRDKDLPVHILRRALFDACKDLIAWDEMKLVGPSREELTRILQSDKN